MKNTIKVKTMLRIVGIIALVSVVTLSLISCGPATELKVINDTSKAVAIEVIIDDETVESGELNAGKSVTYTRFVGFSFQVYVAKDRSRVIKLLDPYWYGDVEGGEVIELRISEF